MGGAILAGEDGMGGGGTIFGVFASARDGVASPRGTLGSTREGVSFGLDFDMNQSLKKDFLFVRVASSLAFPKQAALFWCDSRFA